MQISDEIESDIKQALAWHHKITVVSRSTHVRIPEAVLCHVCPASCSLYLGCLLTQTSIKENLSIFALHHILYMSVPDPADIFWDPCVNL